MPEFAKVKYESLNARQKEAHNLYLIAARLAEYGYASYPIRDDWNGGDMIARHMTKPKEVPLTIQVKGRATFAKKYQDRDLWIAYRDGASVYLYPHDEVLNRYTAVRKKRNLPLDDNDAWATGGLVSWKKPTAELLRLLKPYELAP